MYTYLFQERRDYSAGEKMPILDQQMRLVGYTSSADAPLFVYRPINDSGTAWDRNWASFAIGGSIFAVVGFLGAAACYIWKEKVRIKIRESSGVRKPHLSP